VQASPCSYLEQQAAQRVHERKAMKSHVSAKSFDGHPVGSETLNVILGNPG
jgi:hypothetical protein